MVLCRGTFFGDLFFKWSRTEANGLHDVWNDEGSDMALLFFVF